MVVKLLELVLALYVIAAVLAPPLLDGWRWSHRDGRGAGRTS